MLVLLVVSHSCQKSDENGAVNSQANVRVSLSVGEPDEERVTVGSSKTVRRTSEATIQKSSIALDKGLSMEVTVVQNPQSVVNSGVSNSQGMEKKAAVQSIVKPLEKGVKYRVAVYSESGSYIESHDYAYGNESTTPGFPLDAGKTYTFVVYSVNSKTELPEIDSRSSLSVANLKNVSGDLMFFTKKMKLNFGNNDLSAVLQHKFSQITTTIEMDNSMTGSIEAISGIQVGPTRGNATLMLSDGGLSYSQSAVNSNIIFGAIVPGSRSLTSNPALIISPTTGSASINIGSIRVDSETKTNISIPEVKIVPGQKYSLILRFKTCSEDVTADGMDWSYPQTSWKVGSTTYTGIYKTDEQKYYKNNEVIQNTFMAPQANYGFQFDITELDNAFNMRVNGQYIFKTSDQEQIQFETASSLGIVRNIQFADGSDYTVGGIDQVYNMKGSLQTPLIRLLISRTGEVTMLGSKVNNGPLFPLKLKNNLTFNKVSWNASGTNTVIVTQKVAGRTIIKGKGSGKKRITCS